MNGVSTGIVRPIRLLLLKGILEDQKKGIIAYCAVEAGLEVLNVLEPLFVALPNLPVGIST
jgi:hypothetical protein